MKWMRRERLILGGALLVACLGGCEKKTESASEDATKTQDASPRPEAAGSEAALSQPKADQKAEPDYLVPPTQYGEHDVIRDLLVSGGDVYFATLSDVFRVPLTGGASTAISKTPGMTLAGQFVLWEDGERLVAQSPSEPIFMESPKAGGPWKTFLDLTPNKVGGGRDAVTRLFQGLGKGEKKRATFADFDGTDFYLSLQNVGAMSSVSSSSILKVPLNGGTPEVLLDTPGEIDEVHRYGKDIVFKYTKLPSAEQLAEYEKARKKTPYTPKPKGPTGVFAFTPGAGQPRLLMSLTHMVSSLILVGDESQVLLTGFEEGDFKRGGTFRVSLAGGAPQKIDARPFSGEGFVYGDSFVIAGSASAQPGALKAGEVVLVVPRARGQNRQVTALVDEWTTHARALAGDTLLLCRYSERDNRAAVVRIGLKP